MFIFASAWSFFFAFLGLSNSEAKKREFDQVVHYGPTLQMGIPSAYSVGTEGQWRASARIRMSD
jgi:hypothetical protein